MATIREVYLPTDNASPTVRIESLFKVLSIAAHKKMELGNIDLTGAFLNAKQHWYSIYSVTFRFFNN